jgi:DNA polymerase (family 10)
MAEKSTSQERGLRRPGSIIAGPNPTNTETEPFLSNADIADRLASLAQLLSAQKENPYKVKAYQRAAAKLRNMSESLQELVLDDADLTRYAGIGDAIASAIREIVQTGSLRKLETLRSQASSEVASINDYPRLDPKRIKRIYKKFGISTVDELRATLESGDIEKVLGLRMAQHVRQA